jgi:hypothetical protein
METSYDLVFADSLHSYTFNHFHFMIFVQTFYTCTLLVIIKQATFIISFPPPFIIIFEKNQQSIIYSRREREREEGGRANLSVCSWRRNKERPDEKNEGGWRRRKGGHTTLD